MLLRQPNVDSVGPRRRFNRPRAHRRTVLQKKERNWHVSTKLLQILLIIAVVALLILIFTVLFWTSLFRIDQPVITGVTRVSKESIAEALKPILSARKYLVLPGNALLSISQKQVEQAALQTSPAIASIEVRKELPNVLKIIVHEREPLAIWSAAGQFFFIDERGIAYDEIQRSESRDVSLPVIVDEGARATVEQDRVVTAETLTFVRAVFNDITRTVGIGINFFVAPSRLAPDLTLVTSEGWKIIFDATKPAEQQVIVLKEVLETQVKDKKNLEYIDLRIPGRVFVK